MSFVEWAEFHIHPRVTEAQLVLAAQTMQTRFLSLQPGYRSRQLLALGPGHYADLVFWQDAETASKAMQAARTTPACRDYFGLLSVVRPIGLGTPVWEDRPVHAAHPGIGGLEFSLFTLVPGATEHSLAQAASQMARGLYDHEPGFIEHMVVRNSTGLYADVVLASDAERARDLCGKWGQGPFAPACQDYLALIEPASVRLEFWSRVA